MDDLFTDYDSTVLPTEYLDKALNVTLDLALYKIIELVSTLKYMSMKLTLSVPWATLGTILQ